VRAILRQSTFAGKARHDRILRNLLTYVDLQLARMLARTPPPVDLMALITRDLIEVALWCEYVTASRENMQHFSDEVGIDIVDMFRLIDPSDENYPRLERRVKAMGVTGKSMRLEKSGARDKFWFKLCSKMVHPTAWSINVLLNTRRAEYWRIELGGYALSCAIRAVCSLTDLPLPPYIRK
jgi:hypothetical protein